MTTQLALFAATAPATRTWADVRTGDRFAYNLPGSEWNGAWTVRRIEAHPGARYLLIVTLTDEHGRTWVTWCHRDVAVPGCGFGDPA